jgi:hypothetical protein
MNQFDRLIAAAAKQARKKGLSAGLDSITPRTVRERSSQESSAEWHPPGWGILFCPHNKSYFDTCGHCRRDRKRAQLEFELFCKRRGIQL